MHSGYFAANFDDCPSEARAHDSDVEKTAKAANATPMMHVFIFILRYNRDFVKSGFIPALKPLTAGAGKKFPLKEIPAHRCRTGMWF
jgi:hypothetical protein